MSRDNAPRVWLQASTATLYAHRYDAPNDEATGIIGGSEPNAPDTWRFSIDVVKKWERELNAAATPNTRKVLMRSAIVMGPDRGGPFDMLLRLVRFGLGGRFGDGKEFVSWIHDQDFVRTVDWLIQQEGLEGPVNLAAPNPLPNCGVHANSAQGVGHAVWLAGDRMDVGVGCVCSSQRNRTHAQESSGGSGPAA